MEKDWNFDEVIDRSGTSSMKWEPQVLVSKFGEGREGSLPGVIKRDSLGSNEVPRCGGAIEPASHGDDSEFLQPAEPDL